MNFILKNINWTKKSGILIIGICLSAMLLRFFIEDYRGTWIYRYGAPFTLFTFYGGVFWSLLNTILLIVENKFALKENLIWILISAIPILYIAIMMIIVMLQ